MKEMKMELIHFWLLSNIVILCASEQFYKKCKEYPTGSVEETPITIGVDPSVFGGELASAEEFPHMATLGYKDEDEDEIVWYCSGSLISEDYVLTSAHCTYSAWHGNVKFVRLGILNSKVDTDEAKPQTFNIVSIVKFPEFKLPIRYHDIALVKLDKPANFTKYVRPACLYGKRNLPDYPKAIATGWKKLRFDDASNVLMKVTLTYFTSEVCNQIYSHASKRILPSGILDDLQICAGGINGSKDICQDSYDGPLQIRNYESFYIVGITSFGELCSFIKTPTIYTRVSHYIDWIESVVWPQ